MKTNKINNQGFSIVEVFVVLLVIVVATGIGVLVMHNTKEKRLGNLNQSTTSPVSSTTSASSITDDINQQISQEETITNSSSDTSTVSNINSDASNAGGLFNANSF